MIVSTLAMSASLKAPGSSRRIVSSERLEIMARNSLTVIDFYDPFVYNVGNL